MLNTPPFLVSSRSKMLVPDHIPESSWQFGSSGTVDSILIVCEEPKTEAPTSAPTTSPTLSSQQVRQQMASQIALLRQKVSKESEREKIYAIIKERKSKDKVVSNPGHTNPIENSIESEEKTDERGVLTWLVMMSEFALVFAFLLHRNRASRTVPRTRNIKGTVAKLQGVESLPTYGTQ